MIYEWSPPYPRTIEEAREENLMLHDCLHQLLAHAPGILELASAASVISGDKHRGQVASYQSQVFKARHKLGELRRKRLAANVRRVRVKPRGRGE